MAESPRSRRALRGPQKGPVPGRAKLFTIREFMNYIIILRSAGSPAPPFIFLWIRPPSDTQIIPHGSLPEPPIGAEKEQGKKPTILAGARPFSRPYGMS